MTAVRIHHHAAKRGDAEEAAATVAAEDPDTSRGAGPYPNVEDEQCNLSQFGMCLISRRSDEATR